METALANPTEQHILMIPAMAPSFNKEFEENSDLCAKIDIFKTAIIEIMLCLAAFDSCV